jgi:formylmethanofuran dehydrogenase subunit B
VFGAGGGTSSYREAEETDLIVLWGSNARETHPIFFHHLLRGVHNGARLYAVDPRRTSSAEWADVWLGIDVGSDIALANAIGREIIAAGLQDQAFIDRATSDYEAYKAKVESYTLEYAERETGVPAEAIREMAHAFATADKAMICWTLGITEHHNAVDNVLALIDLVLLTGHVGRWGSGVNPLRGQNNVQGGGDMGALPNRLPGFQHVENDELRAKFDKLWGVTVPPRRGWHLSEMFDAMERGDLRTLYIIGENPAQSEADGTRALRLLQSLDHIVVQDMFLTRTAELAHVVLPAAAAWCERTPATAWLRGRDIRVANSKTVSLSHHIIRAREFIAIAAIRFRSTARMTDGPPPPVETGSGVLESPKVVNSARDIVVDHAPLAIRQSARVRDDGVILVVHRGTGVKEQRAIAVVDDTTARPVAIVEHGAELVRRLSAKGIPVRAMVRTVAKAQELARLPGVEISPAVTARRPRAQTAGDAFEVLPCQATYSAIAIGLALKLGVAKRHPRKRRNWTGRDKRDRPPFAVRVEAGEQVGGRCGRIDHQQVALAGDADDGARHARWVAADHGAVGGRIRAGQR